VKDLEAACAILEALCEQSAADAVKEQFKGLPTRWQGRVRQTLRADLKERLGL